MNYDNPTSKLIFNFIYLICTNKIQEGDLKHGAGCRALGPRCPDLAFSKVGCSGDLVLRTEYLIYDFGLIRHKIISVQFL